MLTINFASQHEETLRMLRQNLQTENFSSNRRRHSTNSENRLNKDEQPLDLRKPKYYTGDYLIKKWVKLCELHQKNANAKRTQSETLNNNKRRKLESVDDTSGDPFQENGHEIFP